MTLSFSGHSYEEQVWDQKMETFVRCHENAFQTFGGVPERIKLDNLKSGVLIACLYEPILNPLYQAFAEYYGFLPDPCIPRKPEHKGRVERDIRYTKDNALKSRRFESLEESNVFPLSQEQAEGWLCTKAKQAGPSCYKLVYAILTGSDNDPMAIRRCRRRSRR